MPSKTIIESITKALGLPSFPKKGVNKFQYLDTRFRGDVSVSGLHISEGASAQLGESLMCGTKFLLPNPLTPTQALPPHIIGTSLSYLLNFGGVYTNVYSDFQVLNNFTGITNINGITNLSGTVNINGSDIYSVFALSGHAHSDRRLKQNIHTITNPIEKVSALRGVNFEFIKDGKKQIGVIAQETEEIIPEVVGECPDGYKTVQYGNIVGLLVEAIKEQQKQIDELKRQVNG